MRYQVRVVPEDALPRGVEWAFAKTLTAAYLFVSEAALSAGTGRCDVLCQAWEAWERAEAHQLVTV
jgi:hypothetical protein